jgi:hypothetical protein
MPTRHTRASRHPASTNPPCPPIARPERFWSLSVCRIARIVASLPGCRRFAGSAAPTAAGLIRSSANGRPEPTTHDARGESLTCRHRRDRPTGPTRWPVPIGDRPSVTHRTPTPTTSSANHTFTATTNGQTKTPQLQNYQRVNMEHWVLGAARLNTRHSLTRRSKLRLPHSLLVCPQCNWAQTLPPRWRPYLSAGQSPFLSVGRTVLIRRGRTRGAGV